MNPISYSFTMDVKKNGTQGVLSGMRSGEVGIRELRISLAYGKETLKFSGEEVAYMFVTRPSDTTPSIEGCKIEGNTIIYEISPNDVAEEGVVNCQLKIVGNKKVLLDGEYWDEEVILYAPSFEMEVTDPNVDESHIPELPVYTALEELLQEFTSRTFDAEAYASGTRNGIPVTKGDIAYQNNAKYFKDEIIEKGAEAVEESMRTAEAFAVGTRNNIPVSEGDVAYHNNSKYYAEEAHTSADNAKSAEASAVSSANYAESRVSEIEGIKNTTEVLRNETEGIRQTTEGYKNDALASKNSAEVSATNASQYATNAFESASRAEGYSIETAQSAELARGYSVSAGASATEASDSADKSETEANRAEAQANRAESIASSVTPTKMSYDAETETLFFEDIGGIGELVIHVDNLEERVTVLEESNADLRTRLTKTERTNKLLVEAVKDTLISFETVDSLTDQTIPTGAMEYAELQSVGGVSRKCKNLFKGFSDSATNNGITVAYDTAKQVISVKGTPTKSSFYINFAIDDIVLKEGLNYAILSKPTDYNITVYLRNIEEGKGAIIPSGTLYNTIETKLLNNLFIYSNDVVIGEPIDIEFGLMIAEGGLVPYEPYTASLIDAKVESVESVGKNLCVNEKDYIGVILNSARAVTLNIGEGIKNGIYRLIIRCTDSSFVKQLYAVFYKGNEIVVEGQSYIGHDGILFNLDKCDADKIMVYVSSTYNGRETQSIQFEEGETVTPYVPYRKPTVTTIPTSILSLPDYGIGVSADCYNYVDFKERKYHHLVTVVDGEMVQLAEEEIIDISDLIDEDFNILSVESGGKVEFNYPNKAEYECEVPNRIEYAIKIADALGGGK